MCLNRFSFVLGCLVLVGYVTLPAVTQSTTGDASAWTTYTIDDGLGSNDVRAIFEDEHGMLWVGTRGGGVSRFDGMAWTTFTTDDGLASDGVLAILEDEQGRLWFAGGPEGVSVFDGEAWTTHGTGGRVVFSIEQARDGSLWFGTNDGALHVDGAAWDTLATDDGLAHRVVHAVEEDKDGVLWFATRRGGLNRYEDGAWSVVFADSNVRRILEARDGTLWVGTSAGGAFQFDGSAWTTFTPVPTLLPECEDQEGGLWFSTEGDGAVHFDGTAWTTLSMADGLPSDAVQVVYEDGAGTLWVGTNAGVSRRMAD